MRFFFADDSKQDSPTRPGMGPLVAIGGVMVSHRELDGLQDDIERACSRAGFPAGEPFKWSPGSELWMHSKLKDAARVKFFSSVLRAASNHGVSALVVIADTSMKKATKAKTHELDVTTMFLERADMEFGRAGTKGVVVADRPGGNLKQQEKFLSNCLDTLQVGTKFWTKAHTVFVVSAPSKLLRLLQLADLVTGCTLSYVSGESNWSPATFNRIQPMLCKEKGSVGGTGVKIHPDFSYANLHHWLLGDTHLRKGMSAEALPMENRPYFTDPNVR
jgi:hypothetical protein